MQFPTCAYLPTNCSSHILQFLQLLPPTSTFAHICQPTVPATNILHTLSNFFSRIFSKQVPQISGLHRCPRRCGRMGGGTGWVWLRTQKLCRTSTLLTQPSAMQKNSVSSIVHLVLQIHKGTTWTRETKYSKDKKDNRPWWHTLNRYNSEGHLLPSTSCLCLTKQRKQQGKLVRLLQTPSHIKIFRSLHRV